MGSGRAPPVSALALAGCTAAPADNGGLEGEVTVRSRSVTWRTDLVENGTFDKYAEEFTAKYPNASVKFEGITDYEGELRTRLSTTNYGDVLGIPNSVAPDQLADFFEPLGQTDELSST